MKTSLSFLETSSNAERKPLRGRLWSRAVSRGARGVVALALVAGLGATARAADGIVIEPPPPPPVVFSVEPEEQGDLVVLPVSPENAFSSMTYMLGLRVTAVNNGAGSEHLNKLRLSFPGYPALTTEFIRDITFSSGQTKTFYLDPEESVRLPHPLPASVRIELFYDGYVTPKALNRDLAAYQAPTGFFLFPGNGKDLGADQYWTQKARHTGGGQFFAYDMGVQGWDPAKQVFSGLKVGGSSDKNEDSLAYGQPVYAMADGIVITAATDLEDNPAPGTRSVQRMTEELAGPITDVKMTRLGATRAVSVVRQPSGTMKVMVWDAQNSGRDLTRLGDVEGEVVDAIAADALTGSRLVTAVRLPNGNLRVIVWGISADGETVTRLSDRDAGGVEEISLVKLSTSRFATAVRTDDGVLRLIVWGVSNDGGTISLLSHEFAGTASSVSVVALSGSRLVTTLRTSQGDLKAIVWDVSDDATTITRMGEAMGDAITKVAVVQTTGSEFVTGARTAMGDLGVVRWSVSDDGLTVTAEASAQAGGIQDVAVAQAWGEAVMTSVITAGGDFKNILWTYPELNRWGDAAGGPTTSMDIEGLDTAVMITGVRTGAGNLKVITWLCGSGGGNSLRILHGDCVVLYAHFKAGSVNPAIAFPGAPVHAGQYLARLGNSGSSSGPHLHIHSTRVSSFVTPQELIEQAKSDTINYLGYRPIGWHGARTMRLDQIQVGGELNPANAFTTMAGHGVYFENYGIRPVWSIPTTPVLNLRAGKGSLTLRWEGEGFRLQAASNCATPRWEDYLRGATSPVDVPLQNNHLFFRLFKERSELRDFGLEPDRVLITR